VVENNLIILISLLNAKSGAGIILADAISRFYMVYPGFLVSAHSPGGLICEVKNP
jgi:hypothetical protein